MKRLIAAFLIATPLLAHAEDPLVEANNVSYMGRFRIPGGSSDGLRFGFGGQALGYNPTNNSLFFGCHDHQQTLAEVSIPTPSKSASYNSLPAANVLQQCRDVTEGTLDSINPTNTEAKKIGGSLVYNGRLITTGWSYYDGGCTQRITHAASSNLNLSQTGNFSGFTAMNGAAYPRGKGGYMGLIPQAWRSRLGGPALTGLGGAAIIGCASSGPTATVFNPDDVGTKNPIPGTTLIHYPDADAPIVAQNFHWLNSNAQRGIAFPEGSRSIIFIGRIGDTQCYGAGTKIQSLHGTKVDPTCVDTPTNDCVRYCYTECSTDKGTHSYPYHGRMWAYDALDFEKVKNGTKAADSLVPYAHWDLDELGECGNVVGATFDPASNNIYLTDSFGEEPQVYVYKVAIPNGGTNPPPNTAPTVNAGPNQAISLPDTATIEAELESAGFPTGPMTYTWTKVSGAGNVTFNPANALTTEASFTLPGTYNLRITANNSALSGNDTITVTVAPRNTAPVANAGSDVVITLPGFANLEGVTTDDNLPNPPRLVTVSWSKVSGPGTVTFSNREIRDPYVTFSAAGTYVLRLTADDSDLTATDDVTVTVNAATPGVNVAPSVDAGVSRTMTFGSPAELDATATDDGLPAVPGRLTYTWSKTGGPGNITFGNRNALDTTATFSSAGEYTMRLTVTDGDLTAIDQLTINVLRANRAPIVVAGNDIQAPFTSPVTAVTLNGDATDDNLPAPPNRITASWSKLSGPGPVSFDDAANVDTMARFTVEGVYTLRLSVTDSELTGTDDVEVRLGAPAGSNNDGPPKQKNFFNPSKGESVTVNCDSDVKIWDKRGGLVRTLSCTDKVAVWDGKTNDAKLAGTGIYFYLFQNTVEKIALLK